MIMAMSSRLAMIRSNQRRRMPERSLAVFRDQALKASSAFSIACVVSAAPKRGTFAMTSPVAGLVTGTDGSPVQAPPT
jgi:hypothetical protein